MHQWIFRLFSMFEVFLTCLHESTHNLDFLPLGGNAVTQMAVSIVAASTIIDIVEVVRKIRRRFHAWRTKRNHARTAKVPTTGASNAKTSKARVKRKTSALPTNAAATAQKVTRSARVKQAPAKITARKLRP